MSQSATLKEEKFLQLPKPTSHNILNDDYISRTNNQLICKFN
jgi:hypothetical protein